MIINLDLFVKNERKYWKELEEILDKISVDPYTKFNLKQTKRFHYLFQRTAADLGEIKTFSGLLEMSQYLETLVAKAYAEIHGVVEKSERRFSVSKWFFVTFPRTFRKHIRAFMLALIVTLLGCLFGGGVMFIHPEAKTVLLPFEHLAGNPADRVAKEEKGTLDRIKGHHSSFSSFLITHNTRMAILVFALGITWGIGTIIVLFYNGVILGAVTVDYIMAGKTIFLAGWLLPHGVVEIPAFIIAGQAGLLIAGTLIQQNSRLQLSLRFRKIAPTLVTLIGGGAVLLVWAGIIESFLSQFHQPIIPYLLKIMFGLLEFALLILFLWKSGSKEKINHND